MVSTRSSDFELGACPGFYLVAHGCAACPGETGGAKFRHVADPERVLVHMLLGVESDIILDAQGPLADHRECGGEVGEVQAAEEAGGGRVVAGGEGAPLLEPGPEVLGLVAPAVGGAAEALRPPPCVGSDRATGRAPAPSPARAPSGGGTGRVADDAPDGAREGGG
jgi:hypothetical protein